MIAHFTCGQGGAAPSRRVITLPAVPDPYRLLQLLIACGFTVLGLSAVLDWLRHRERPRRHLATALCLLALVAVLGQAQPIVGYSEALQDAALVALMASGYVIVLFRGSFIPLTRRERRLALAAVAATTAFALLVRIDPDPRHVPTPVQSIAVLLLVLVWGGCVLEPAVRFWLAARGRPSVQRARLRALSLGFAGLAAVLIFAGAGGAALNPVAQWVTQLVALVAVPLIYVGFSPPRWLRRDWRDREEEQLRQAVQDLILFSPTRAVLAGRALEWATRLVGANAAFIVDSDGSVLAHREIEKTAAEQLFRRLRPAAGPTARLSEDGRRSAVLLELPLARSPGALVVVSGPFTPVFGSDEVARLAQYATAVTAGLDRAVLTERLAALERTKSQFLNLASHELRGPVTVLRGYLSMLNRGTLGAVSPEIEAALPVLVAKTEEMNLMIEQMIEAARLEEGRIELRRERADLRDLASHALTVMRPLMDDSHQLLLDTPEVEVPVVVDRDRIGTILNNLLDNAMKYSPKGGDVRCIVSCEEKVGKVSITDCGVGISPEDAPHLFTRFGRVVNKETSAIRGTGLGLYLSRELARMHGGDITYSSIPGRGSTFTLAVPLAGP
jgi:signal transduction histidine kinase